MQVSFYPKQVGLNIILIGLNALLCLCLIEAMLYCSRKGENDVISKNISSVKSSLDLVSIDKLEII